MTKVEFIERHVSPEGAKFETSAGFLKITHACGCILTQSGGPRGANHEHAELCPHHLEQYEQLKNEQP